MLRIIGAAIVATLVMFACPNVIDLNDAVANAPEQAVTAPVSP